MTLEGRTGGAKADDIPQGLKPRARSPLSYSSLFHINERNHQMGKRVVWFISARRHSETGVGWVHWGDGRDRRQGVQTRARLR